MESIDDVTSFSRAHYGRNPVSAITHQWNPLKTSQQCMIRTKHTSDTNSYPLIMSDFVASATYSDQKIIPVQFFKRAVRRYSRFELIRKNVNVTDRKQMSCYQISPASPSGVQNYFWSRWELWKPVNLLRYTVNVYRTRCWQAIGEGFARSAT